MAHFRNYKLDAVLVFLLRFGEYSSAALIEMEVPYGSRPSQSRSDDYLIACLHQKPNHSIRTPGAWQQRTEHDMKYIRLCLIQITWVSSWLFNL